MTNPADPVEGVLFVQSTQQVPGKSCPCDQQQWGEKVQSAVQERLCRADKYHVGSFASLPFGQVDSFGWTE